MNCVTVCAYDVGKRGNKEVPTEPAQLPDPTVHAAIVCPVCWDHAVEPIEGIVLPARAIGGRDLSQVSLYRCSHWHLFALFYQPADWEQA